MIPRFELHPWTSPAVRPDARAIVWPDPTAPTGEGVRTRLDAWLTSFGTVPDRAIDLARLGAAAFFADQMVERPQSFSRSLDIAVQLTDPAAWSDDLLADLADLLASLTGDAWTIRALADASPARPTHDPLLETPAATRVALLSGGLDSFAGAVLSSAEPGTIYLGHSDQTAVKKAQDCVGRWFHDSGRPLDYTQITLAVGKAKAEGSTRSRSLLFMALGVALATARGARVVEVPENGHTSLNPPLGPDRGGALTTRSTHPRTFARLNAIVAALGLDVEVGNPHGDKTKGELVALANAAAPGDFAAGVTDTLSCAKLNGNYYKGGNPNYACGLCVACIVRRASLIAAGVADRTPYLCDTLTGEALSELRGHRAPDVEAVKMAIAAGIDEVDLLAIGPYPDEFDLDAGLDVCRRALAEMGHVPL